MLTEREVNDFEATESGRRLTWADLENVKARAFKEGMRLGRDVAVFRILKGTPPMKVHLDGIDPFDPAMLDIV